MGLKAVKRWRDEVEDGRERDESQLVTAGMVYEAIRLALTEDDRTMHIEDLHIRQRVRIRGSWWRIHRLQIDGQLEAKLDNSSLTKWFKVDDIEGIVVDDKEAG